MSNFQLENNVPDVYVDESRDFQLLCRVIDIYFKGCMNRAADMRYQLDIDNCNESLLRAIAHMQGFITNMDIPANVLRNILKVFPWCIKRKGTEEAISVAAYAVMATYKNIYQINVAVVNTDGNYRIDVSLAGTSRYLEYVREVLRFLVPAGYEVVVRNVLIRNDEEDDRSTIEEYVSSVSGIPGVIMGAYKPVSMEPDKSTGTGSKTGYYSKIGLAKLIRAKSTKELLEEKSMEEVNLIDADGKPVVVYRGMEVKDEN